ncbi:MAG: hypothetical protein F4029_03910 [Gammaproteobacteria bacterium]|nr:hypothetical protein [Gammaproteobacteria bacterium]
MSHDLPDVLAARAVVPDTDSSPSAMTTYHHHRSALSGALVAFLLGACTAPTPNQPEPTPVEPAPPPDIAAPDPGETEAFLDLIDTAERALDDDRLLTPEDDSAYFYYQQASAMAPNHPATRRGFERIVERYLQLAQLAMEREQWPHAGFMLARAEYVDRSHTGIAPMREQLEMLSNAERLTLRLDRTALRERTPGIASELVEFGRQARSDNARVSIRVPSDADGRWVYQQLSRSPGEKRIRGRIEIGLPPQVTVLLLPAET